MFMYILYLFFFFFFQAEDGIRDLYVTGVQTCALPIWASSLGSDFNFDFNVSLTEEQQRDGSAEYNYRRNGHKMDLKQPPEPVVQFAAACGTDAPTYVRDRPGMSAFVLEDGVIYHTYSTYARGLDGLWGAYQWLDRAPKGRNETGVWWRRHDEYAPARQEA